MIPAFLVKTAINGVYAEHTFSELYNMRDQIITLTVMWDYNSYLIDLYERHIVINGGRALRMDLLTQMEDPKLYYRKRHMTNIGISDGKTKQDRLSYVVGAEGIVAGKLRQIYMLIKGDGTEVCIEGSKTKI